MTQGNMIVLDKTKITGISPVDYPQWEQENGLIYLSRLDRSLELFARLGNKFMSRMHECINNIKIL